MSFCFAMWLCAWGSACSASVNSNHNVRSTVRNVQSAGYSHGHVTISGDRILVDDHINFASNSDTILEHSYDVLDDVVKALKNQHKAIKAVKVLGHTDTRGDSAYNKELSERRAQSVREYLMEKGVQQTLTALGRGEAEPLCQDDSEGCHARNRRVEFFIERK